MQSNSRIRLNCDAVDEIDEVDGEPIDAVDLDTTVHLDVATGRIMFQAAWAPTTEDSPEIARHAVVLVLDCDTMERYADLDENARMRVHAILHYTVQDRLDRLSDADESPTLTIELTDAMLDAARHLQ
ncbi:MAG: hypothetical protein IOC39_07205 [Burkholderia sp.]|uniref:hypothetical protein n=1 Tax=Burkholderia sp. TaxID=36773 RepID=UPI002584A755|nr:hypothetical protein [Burkholderia sp.]MCA3781806.1 hypothetical protein [Burkholderia sp.]MCA3787422.1 hypothetical protein [Burkholderia sp.]MCA3791390.1 hypothetical protein [Burkholderia sp.]MCA3801759.1 hypothetical protein [Burkholderia sp.]MCA3811513.1 hypothetical protein [Burkholderia sp.]